MKRSDALAPLSRDHQHALYAALRLRRAHPATVRDAVESFLRFFEEEGRRHFEIEVKRPGDPSSQLTELQTRRLLEWKLAGAVTGVARSVEDALVILGLARPERSSADTEKS